MDLLLVCSGLGWQHPAVEPAICRWRKVTQPVNLTGDMRAVQMYGMLEHLVSGIQNVCVCARARMWVCMKPRIPFSSFPFCSFQRVKGPPKISPTKGKFKEILLRI